MRLVGCDLNLWQSRGTVWTAVGGGVLAVREAATALLSCFLPVCRRHSGCGSPCWPGAGLRLWGQDH